MKNFILFFKSGFSTFLQNKWQLIFISVLTFLVIGFFSGGMTTIFEISDNYQQIANKSSDYLAFSRQQIFSSEQTATNRKANTQLNLLADLLPSYFLKTNNNNITTPFFETNSNIKVNYFNDSSLLSLNPFFKTDFLNLKNWKKYWSLPTEFHNIYPDHSIAYNPLIIRYTNNAWTSKGQVFDLWNSNQQLWQSNNVPKKYICFINGFNWKKFYKDLAAEIKTKIFTNLNDSSRKLDSNLGIARYSVIFLDAQKKYQLFMKNNTGINNLQANVFWEQNSILSDYIQQIALCMTLYLSQELINWINDFLVPLIDVQDKSQLITDLKNGHGVNNYYLQKALPFFIHQFTPTSTKALEDNAYHYSTLSQVNNLWETLSYSFLFNNLNTKQIKDQNLNEPKNAVIKATTLNTPLFHNNIYDPLLPKNNVIIENVGQLVTKNFVSTPNQQSSAQEGSKGLFYKLYKSSDHTNNILGWRIDDARKFLWIYAKYPYWFVSFFNKTIFDHYYLIADLNKLKYHFCYETKYTDNFLKKTFLIKTITDSLNYNLAEDQDATFKKKLLIYQGIVPNKKHQVAISLEFAHKNNFSLNQQLIINPHLGKLTISGIGIIPLDFFPGTNPDIGLNSEDNGIIYSDSQVVFNLFIWQKMQTTFFQNFFSRNKNYVNKIPKTVALLNLKAFLHSNPENMANSLIYIKDNFINHENKKFSPKQLDINNIFQDFATSNYNQYNHVVWNKIYLGFIIMFVVIFLFSFATYLISLYFISNQTIKKQRYQIAIIKSLGTKNFNIIALVMPLVFFILFMIIFGWLAGLGLQTIIIHNLSFFYSLQLNSISASFTSLLLVLAIAFLPLIGFLFLVTSLILRKSIFKINNVDFSVSLSNLRVHNRISNFIARRSFKVKLFFNICTLSLYKMILIGLIIFLGSIIISASLFIPNVLTTMATSYFQDSKYDNYFYYQQPSFNNPLSKINLNIWPKTKNQEQYYYFDKKDPSKDHFKNLNDFFLFNDNSSSISPFISVSNNASSSSNKWYWTPNYLNTLANKNNFEQHILNLLTSNFVVLNARNFSTSNLDYLLRWNSDKNTPIPTSGITKAEAKKWINQILNDVFPKILRSIFVYYHGPKVANWKDDINNIILSTLPSYLSKYINSPFKKSVFAFGWNNATYIPGYDNLATKITPKLTLTANKQQKDLNINPVGYGLSKSQNAIKISDDLKNQLYGNEAKTALKNLSNPQYRKDIIVPIVMSKQAQAINHLYKNEILNSNRVISSLNYLTKDKTYQPINPNWWVYDDSKYGQDLYDTSDNKEINLAKLNLGKFYHGTNNNLNYKQGFCEVAYLHNKFQLRLRPYYNWKNVKLYLPVKKVDLAYYKHEANDAKNDFHGNQLFNLSDVTKITTGPHQGFYCFHPFSFAENSVYNNSNLAVLVTPILDLYDRFTENNILKTGPLYLDKDVKFDFSDLQLNNANIKYKIIGFNNIYNENAYYLDQNLANKILGYPNTLTNQFNYKVFSVNKKTKKIDQYNQVVPGSYTSKNLKIQNTNNLPHAWFNSKFSDVKSPFDISANIALSDVNSNNSIYQISHYESLLVKKVDLFSARIHFILIAAEGAITITTLLIGSSFICAIILSFLVFEMFVEDFKKFMILMRAEGYKIREILNNTVAIFLPVILVAATLGYLLVYGIINVAIKILNENKFYIYYNFQIWTILVTLGIILFIYLFIYLVAKKRLKTYDFKEIQT